MMVSCMPAAGGGTWKRTADRLSLALTARMPATIAALGLLMLAAYLCSVLVFPKRDGRVVLGDATHYYVQLRSMVFDRDLDFKNEYTELYHLRGTEFGTQWIANSLTPTGRIRNYMPVGPALLAAPLYILAAGAQWALSLAGLVPAPTGYERTLQAVPGVTGVLAATLAAWLAWRLARRHADDRSSAYAVLAVWLGSSALYYSLVSPAYSHAASMLAASLFCVRWLEHRDDVTARRSLELGVLAGVATLMRWQDVVLLVVLVLDLLGQPSRWRDRLVRAGVAGLGWLAVFSPQMLVWQVLYGQPLAIPQGPSFMRWDEPHLLDVLFSPLHGLFSWTPIVIPAVAGLAVFCRRRGILAVPIIAWVLLAWYVNGAVADWWAGEAFGARRFLSLFPLFVVGLATWLAGGRATPRTGRVVLAGALVAANLLLLFQYQLFMRGLRDVAPYPSGWFDLYAARFVVPARFIGWWLGN